MSSRYRTNIKKESNKSESPVLCAGCNKAGGTLIKLSLGVYSHRGKCQMNIYARAKQRALLDEHYGAGRDEQESPAS